MSVYKLINMRTIKHMNKNYKESKEIMRTIEVILELNSPLGETEKTKELRNQLEAIAEIAYIQGGIDKSQFIRNNQQNIFQQTKNTGEWCEKCKAWKQYGIADTHYCKGYTITC